MDPLIIGGIILFIVIIIILAYAYKSMYESNLIPNGHELIWPDTISRCPDYWTDIGNGKCQNTFNIGNCPIDNNILVPDGILDFGTAPYINVSNPKAGGVAKCNKAHGCGLTWDGLDNLC